MNGRYVCGICDRICTTLDEYVEHVKNCSDRVIKEKAETAARLAKLNAEIEEVKKAKAVIAKFKKEHPYEYEMNFGKCDCKTDKAENHTCSCGSHVPNQPTVPKMPKDVKKKREDNKISDLFDGAETVELYFNDNGNGKSDLSVKVNGEEVDVNSSDFNEMLKKYQSSISQHDFYNWVMNGR